MQKFKTTCFLIFILTSILLIVNSYGAKTEMKIIERHALTESNVFSKITDALMEPDINIRKTQLEKYISILRENAKSRDELAIRSAKIMIYLQISSLVCLSILSFRAAFRKGDPEIWTGC